AVEPFIGLAVAVVVELVTHLGAGRTGPRRALEAGAVRRAHERAGLEADAGPAVVAGLALGRKVLVDLGVAVVVEVVAALAANRIGEDLRDGELEAGFVRRVVALVDAGQVRG